MARKSNSGLLDGFLECASTEEERDQIKAWYNGLSPKEKRSIKDLTDSPDPVLERLEKSFGIIGEGAPS